MNTLPYIQLKPSINMLIKLIPFFYFFVVPPTWGVDLFSTAKGTIKDTAGTGSGIEMAMLVVGALSAAVFGLSSRNWYVAIGGFAGGMIFWNVVKPLIGLG